MSLILRWFYDNGERHRAFFRQPEASQQRELVIASRNWEMATPATPDTRLEDLTDDRLIAMVRRGRDSYFQAPARG